MCCSFGDTDVRTPSCVSRFCTERIPPKRRAFGSEISAQPEDTESSAETESHKCLLCPTVLAFHFTAEFAKESAGLVLGPAEICFFLLDNADNI